MMELNVSMDCTEALRQGATSRCGLRPRERIVKDAEDLIEHATKDCSLTATQVLVARIYLIADNAPDDEVVKQASWLQELVSAQPQSYIEYLGFELFFKHKRYRPAIACFKRLVESDPADGPIRLNLAISYGRLGMFSEADAEAAYLFENHVSLTNYGSHASPLTGRQNYSPGYDPRKYAVPPAPRGSVTLHVPDTASSGQQFTATATVQAPGRVDSATLTAPAGWTVGSASRNGNTFSWPVTAPTGTLTPAALKVTAKWGRETVTDERIVGAVPAAPPSGPVAVSSLPFLSATNGWGPVERDTSNGEAAVGDGKPITIGGVQYAKGLGTNAVSDVQVYLAGKCTRFTASVGVDAEAGNSGTVTFAVSVDGKTLATTPVLKGNQPAATIDVPVTGGQVLDLLVGDGGDGNGLDHADWAVPTLTCT